MRKTSRFNIKTPKVHIEKNYVFRNMDLINSIFFSILVAFSVSIEFDFV